MDGFQSLFLSNVKGDHKWGRILVVGRLCHQVLRQRRRDPTPRDFMFLPKFVSHGTMPMASPKILTSQCEAHWSSSFRVCPQCECIRPIAHAWCGERFWGCSFAREFGWGGWQARRRYQQVCIANACVWCFRASTWRIVRRQGLTSKRLRGGLETPRSHQPHNFSSAFKNLRGESNVFVTQNADCELVVDRWLFFHRQHLIFWFCKGVEERWKLVNPLCVQGHKAIAMRGPRENNGWKPWVSSTHPPGVASGIEPPQGPV